jgi:alkanesulfonate monooxygenase SsuD/methylene tetrahydromethanopterin reductase-like flavin-dependent oxidoreductase (luciferase family)
VRHAIFVPNFGTFCDPLLVADLASRSESAGWDGWFLWDHVVHRLGDEPAVDPWVTLAAVAMHTNRIKLGPMVTPVPRRRPWNLARQAATLDHLSAGRVVLGVGIGASGTPEFDGFGEEEDLVKRAAMLDEGLEVIAALWAGDHMHHRGEHYKVEGVRFTPAPVQNPLPIWIAAVWPHRRPLRRAAHWQGVVPLGLPGPQTLEEVFAIVGPGKDVAVKSDEHPARSWEQAGATWMLHEVGRDWPVSRVESLIDAGPVDAGPAGA